MIDPGLVAENLAHVRERIARAGGDPGRITVVAATKGFGPDAVHAAMAAGVLDIGESRAQELIPKADAVHETAGLDLGDGPRWHFMATVQRNKVAALVPYVHLWQAVDRLVVGKAIAERAPGAAVLVQVNLTDDPGRGGCAIGLAPGVVAGLTDLGLDVRGLMCVGPLGPPEAARSGFSAVANLRAELGLDELSMGMTEDLEVAVEEGATMVRMGRALFGPRPSAPHLRR